MRHGYGWSGWGFVHPVPEHLSCLPRRMWGTERENTYNGPGRWRSGRVYKTHIWEERSRRLERWYIEGEGSVELVYIVQQRVV